MYVTVIMLVAVLSFLPAGFHGQHFAIPAGDSSPLDIPCPDPNDDENMDVPDQQALMDASMAGNPFQKPIKIDVLSAKVHI
jgi:hypothetical protein